MEIKLGDWRSKKKKKLSQGPEKDFGEIYFTFRRENRHHWRSESGD